MASAREDVAMRLAVLGDPIEHSLSPVMHRAALAAAGLEWAYEPVRVPAGSLADFVDSLDEQWRGVSMTMPLKREAMALAGARPTERATRVGGANTLLLPERVLDNTDLPGAEAALRERGVLTCGTAAILGGGATAASAGLAVAALGATRVHLLVRDPARAQPTVDVIERSGAVVVVGGLADRPDVDVLVSTVPVTAQDASLVSAWADVPVLFDVHYDPWPTPLAAAASGVVVGGLDLLVQQAVLQFELFTGESASAETMREAAQAAIDRRRRGRR
jgi:shikimate dehydrogenase